MTFRVFMRVLIVIILAAFVSYILNKYEKQALHSVEGDLLINAEFIVNNHTFQYDDVIAEEVNFFGDFIEIKGPKGCDILPSKSLQRIQIKHR